MTPIIRLRCCRVARSRLASPVFALALLAWSVGPAAAQSSGLVAAYSFNEGLGATATDASGNGNTARLVSNATWSTDGKFQGAISVGSESFVSAPPSSVVVAASATWNAPSTQFAIELWIRIKEIGDYKAAMAVGPWESATAYVYSVGRAWSPESYSMS